MKKALKRSLSVMFVVVLLSSMFAIPASAKTCYYTKPPVSTTFYITTYTLKNNGKSVPAYKDSALTQRDGKHSLTLDNDPCQILEIGKTSVRVRYLLSAGGTHTAWFPANVFVNNSQTLNSYYRYVPLLMDETYTVYKRPGSGKMGEIYGGDEYYRIWILDGTQSGNYVQVIYLVTVGSARGTYKMGWMRQDNLRENGW